MPNITLRRLNLETNATESAELVNTIMPDPVTIDRVREWAQRICERITIRRTRRF